MKSIEEVYNNQLCCSCGFCEGACPTGAVQLKVDAYGFYKPVVTVSKCNDCGICINHCPGVQYFPIIHRPVDYAYGHSNNTELRFMSSSGGLATELMIYLVKNNYVDFVVVVKNREFIGEPEIIITRDLDEIKSCATSKYCPVPLNRVITKLKEVNGSIAIIGLPCHIQALKSYSIKNKNLSYKIKYTFSLFCNHSPSFNATLYLFKNLNLNNPVSIIYRGHGWPGYITIKSSDGEIHLPYRKTASMGFGLFFKHPRCMLCNDPFGDKADISFGDAYFVSNNGPGNTFCHVRSKEIMEVLLKMVLEKVITLYKLNGNTTYDTSFASLHARQSDFRVIASIFIKLKKEIPININSELEKVTFLQTLNLLKKLMIFRLSRYPLAWHLFYFKYRIKGESFKKNTVTNIKDFQ